MLSICVVSKEILILGHLLAKKTQNEVFFMNIYMYTYVYIHHIYIYIRRCRFVCLVPENRR